MSEKVALIIIYNHQFNKNIPIVERLYSNRFNHIYHVVPFYDGDIENVLPVYENSHFFQGYAAQGIQQLKLRNKKFEHYFFIGDDLILNPIINQDNYKEYLKLNAQSSFIPSFIDLHNSDSLWGRVKNGFDYDPQKRGVEIHNVLPTKDEALARFEMHNLEVKSIPFSKIWIYPSGFMKQLIFFIKNPKHFLRLVNAKLKSKEYELKYPLVGSYSDIFVVSGESINDFSKICGAFAATDLFVEIAIPTALVLSSDAIVTENDLELSGKALWPDGWARLDDVSKLAKGDFEELNKYNYSLTELLNDFPKGRLYLHPIKLSKWK